MDEFFTLTTCFIYLFVGLVLLVAEAFIPSFGVLTVISFVFAGAAVYSAFHVGAYTLGYIVLVAVAVGFPAILILMFKNLHRLPGARKLVPPPPDKEADDEDVEMSKLVGREGVALTPMMPTGVIKIEGKKLDALTSGERIEKNSIVVVRHIEGNRIYVRKKG